MQEVCDESRRGGRVLRCRADEGVDCFDLGGQGVEEKAFADAALAESHVADRGDGADERIDEEGDGGDLSGAPLGDAEDSAACGRLLVRVLGGLLHQQFEGGGLHKGVLGDGEAVDDGDWVGGDFVLCEEEVAPSAEATAAEVEAQLAVAGSVFEGRWELEVGEGVGELLFHCFG